MAAEQQHGGSAHLSSYHDFSREQETAMKQSQTIECPKCHHQFNIEDVIQNRMEDEVAQRIATIRAELEHQAQKDQEALKKREEDLNRRLRDQEKLVNDKLAEREQQLRKDLKEDLRKETERKLQSLQDDLQERTLKIEALQEKELELERLKRKDKEREQDYAIRLEREKNELAQQLEEQIRRQEGEKIDLKLAEKDKQLGDLRKQLEEARRKAEQGSMQLQGEVQELAIEDALRSLFLQDEICEVPKGTRGADTIQVVRNDRLEACGKIIYESKRSKHFNNGWIAKLKEDQQREGADVAVLVSEVLPESINRIGQLNGVWVCDYHVFQGLAMALRDGLLKFQRALKTQANKGDKMEMLYDYLTGTEFKMQIEAIVEGFTALRDGITKERVQMEKIWKEREKQIDRVLLNTTGFYGSVKGIAGNAVPTVALLEVSGNMRE
jgi:hypothetical protein